MHVAYHFDEESTPREDYLNPLRHIERATLASLLELIPRYRQHVRVRSGDAGGAELRSGSNNSHEIASKLLADASIWTTLHSPKHLGIYITTRPAVTALIEGISLEDAVALDRHLRRRPDYVGAIQVRADLPIHWAFYPAVLPLRYRVHRGMVDVLHSMTEDPSVTGADDERDHGWLDDLRQFLKPRGAVAVNFGSSGLEDTLFDPHYGSEQAMRSGRVDRILGSVLTNVGDEIYIRARELDPRLIEVFDAMLVTLERQDSNEQLSQVALSCRRLLERLADALYPPRSESINGRKLGQAQYINRLWQFVSDALSDTQAKVVLANLTDVGQRIDALHSAANSGLHGVAEAAATHRLVVNLTLLTFDLLVLRGTNAGASASYEKEQVETMRGILFRNREP